MTATGRHRQVAPVAYTTPRLSRRDLIKVSSIAAVGVAAGVGGQLLGESPAIAATRRWPGHKPGRIYLGVGTPDLPKTLSRTGRIGLRRTYYGWDELRRERKNIQADHANRRLPWVSFKTPSGGWAAIAAGRYDADLRARARHYARLDKPVIVTFNHEPQNDRGNPADFVRAWIRVHDVMQDETDLKKVAHVPIIGEWTFSPLNRRMDPADWVTRGMLRRCAFLGTDLYQNDTGWAYRRRVGNILNFMEDLGFGDKMVGIGETGATNGFGNRTGANWFRRSWEWAENHTSRIGAISYFNSRRNNNLKQNWLLWETSAKLAAYKKALASSTFTRL